MASRGTTKRKKKQTKKQTKKAKRKPARHSPKRAATAKRCGLCGATKNLTKTECCGQWICDDEHTYRMFSYARNSCYRNHDRYTLCGYHFTEGHSGHWTDCARCREEIETEMYVYYGTNEYNFEVLQDPPDYEPTTCAACGRVIVLAEGGYSQSYEGYFCGPCTAKKHPGLFR